MKECDRMFKREFCSSGTGYNRVVAMGWVIILQDNRPINYYANCSDPEEDLQWQWIDGVFAELCSRYDEVNITKIISAYNRLKDDLDGEYKYSRN